MKMTQDFGAASHLITGYEAGMVRVNETIHRTSLIVTPEHVDPQWAPEAFEDLDLACFQALLDAPPEIVLLGTGARLRFPPREIILGFRSRGIGFEVMDTGAACRTYNILMAEGRPVAAALLMIERR
ncbi:Mth938-like domain-containing protein [Thioalkalivibrio sulfidiphilus]|nr:Mth938-like domain-containing protein [Thioalkalivibrio sulfidiphilus]